MRETFLTQNTYKMKRKYFLLLLIILILLARNQLVISQCPTLKVYAVSYFSGECGGRNHQSLVGTNIPIYGNNGLWYFTSVLTNDIQKTVSAEDTYTTGFVIYPNPVLYGLNIEWEHEESAEVSIWNQLGQKLFKTEISPHSLSTVDVSELKTGYYILKAKTKDNKQFYQKFIKQ